MDRPSQMIEGTEMTLSNAVEILQDTVARLYDKVIDPIPQNETKNALMENSKVKQQITRIMIQVDRINEVIRNLAI